MKILHTVVYFPEIHDGVGNIKHISVLIEIAKCTIASNIRTYMYST